MSQDQIEALWRRTDEHGRAINDLTITQQVQVHQITSQEQRFERHLVEQAEAKAEILEAVRGHHKREGVKEFAKLALPWIVTVLGGAVWLIQIVVKP